MNSHPYTSAQRDDYADRHRGVPSSDPSFEPWCERVAEFPLINRAMIADARISDLRRCDRYFLADARIADWTARMNFGRAPVPLKERR